MNKIIKWTIGKANKSAIFCLRRSILQMKKLMPEAKLVICHNSDKDLLPVNLVDEVIDQRVLDLNPQPVGPAWKLYPPRLDLNCWEIWMDSDIILFDLPDELKNLTDVPVVCEAFKRSYSPQYDSQIPEGICYNTGILVLPPKFEFGIELDKHIPEKWEGHFDEQSIVTIILQKMNPKIISLKKIQVLCIDEKYKEGECGVHFVGLNSGFLGHWKTFLNTRKMH